MEIKGGNETFYFTKLHIDFSFINKYHMFKELSTIQDMYFVWNLIFFAFYCSSMHIYCCTFIDVNNLLFCDEDTTCKHTLLHHKENLKLQLQVEVKRKTEFVIQAA